MLSGGLRDETLVLRAHGYGLDHGRSDGGLGGEAQNRF